MSDLLDNLRHAIQLQGLSQAALADRTGYAQPQISRWLSGRREIPLPALMALARAAGFRLALVPIARGGNEISPDVDASGQGEV